MIFYPGSMAASRMIFDGVSDAKRKRRRGEQKGSANMYYTEKTVLAQMLLELP